MSGDLVASETIGSKPRFSFLPMMITRLMLSLKKSATPQEDGWGLGEPTKHSTIRFAERRGGDATRYEIRLDTLASTHEGTQDWT